jgi:hypothetical protein
MDAFAVKSFLRGHDINVRFYQPVLFSHKGHGAAAPEASLVKPLTTQDL